MRVRELATRINQRFPEATHPPIILKAEHHQPDTIFEYYRGADVCAVTSLHDGMNLVAKEFVAAQDPENPGALVLSNMAGAARELTDALLVNPYDEHAVAAALREALELPLADRRERHAKMLAALRSNTIRHWHESFVGALRRRECR
jgi:trehalose 6-phosphate synthase